MQTQNDMVQELIKYIKECFEGSTFWSNPTPRTFLGRKSICEEIVCVYISDHNITIIHDGKDVVDGIEMIRLGSLKHLENDLELREKVFSDYLNDITSRL